MDTNPTYTMESVDLEPTDTMTSINFDPSYTVTPVDTMVSTDDTNPTNTMPSVDFDSSYDMTSDDSMVTFTVVPPDPKPSNTMNSTVSKLTPTITPIDDSMQFVERVYKPTHTMNSMGPLDYSPKNPLIPMSPPKHKYFNRIFNKRPLKYKSLDRSKSKIGLKNKTSDLKKSIKTKENKETSTTKPDTSTTAHDVTLLKEISKLEFPSDMKIQEANVSVTPLVPVVVSAMSHNKSLSDYKTNDITDDAVQTMSNDDTKMETETKDAEKDATTMLAMTTDSGSSTKEPKPSQTHSSITSSASSTSVEVRTSRLGPKQRPRQTHGLKTYPAIPSMRMSVSELPVTPS